MDLKNPVRRQHQPVDDPLAPVSSRIVERETDVALEAQHPALVEEVVPLEVVLDEAPAHQPVLVGDRTRLIDLDLEMPPVGPILIVVVQALPELRDPEGLLAVELLHRAMEPLAEIGLDPLFVAFDPVDIVELVLAGTLLKSPKREPRLVRPHLVPQCHLLLDLLGRHFYSSIIILPFGYDVDYDNSLSYRVTAA